MPDIDLIPVPLQTANQPYTSETDNIPLQGLIDRIAAVNAQVDIDADILRRSIGDMGSLAARLAVSIAADGKLIPAAIDEAAHNIAEHTDGSVLVNEVPVSYVRMLASERDHLSGVAVGATDLTLLVEINSESVSQISQVVPSEVLFDAGQVRFRQSDSIGFRVVDRDVYFDTTFPASARHRHYYDVTPAHATPTSPDYTTYKVVYPYREGSLRVYVNGICLSATDEVMVPTAVTSSSVTWVPLGYAEDEAVSGEVTSRQFTLSAAVTAADVVRVNYDITLS